MSSSLDVVGGDTAACCCCSACASQGPSCFYRSHRSRPALAAACPARPPPMASPPPSSHSSSCGGVLLLLLLEPISSLSPSHGPSPPGRFALERPSGSGPIGLRPHSRHTKLSYTAPGASQSRTCKPGRPPDVPTIAPAFIIIIIHLSSYHNNLSSSSSSPPPSPCARLSVCLSAGGGSRGRSEAVVGYTPSFGPPNPAPHPRTACCCSAAPTHTNGTHLTVPPTHTTPDHTPSPPRPPWPATATWRPQALSSRSLHHT